MCKFFEKISIFLMICLTQPCLFKFYSEFSKSFLKILLTSYRLCAIIANASGCGAVGSALPWGGRGRKFKSCHSDQIKPKTNRFRLYFLHFRGKIERFPTTSAPPEIPKIFLTTYLTTVGAGAIRLVASAPVRSAQKTKFKRFPEVFPPRTFFFVSCVSVFSCSI